MKISKSTGFAKYKEEILEMKKRLAVLFVVGIMSLLMVACGKGNSKVDPVSQKVMNDINALGSIDLSDEKEINKLMSTYATLTDSQKNQVNNYAKLLEAQDKLEDLKASADAAAYAEKEAYLSLERTYYPIVDDAIKFLKTQMKNPSSVEISEIYVRQMGKVTYVYMHCTAENDLGGRIDSEWFYYTYNKYGAKIDIDDFGVREMVKGKDKELKYKIGENFYCETEQFSSTSNFVFMVDLDDYDN